MDDFSVDLQILQDLAVPAEQKRWMLDIIFFHIVPYRYHQEPRLFPDLGFYATLLNNRNDFYEISGFVSRFHAWINEFAMAGPWMADAAIKSLQDIREQLGLDGAPMPLTDGVTRITSQPKKLLDIAPVLPVGERTSSGLSQKIALVDHRHPLLASEMDKPASLTYQGIIQNKEHFNELNEAYANYERRQPGFEPQEDLSWPATTEMQREYVKKMYNCIAQCSDFYELRRARVRLEKVQQRKKAGSDRSREATNPDGSHEPVQRSKKRKRVANPGSSEDESDGKPEGISRADWELLDQNNTPADLLSLSIHHRISDVEIEIIAWRLLASTNRACLMRYIANICQVAAESAQLGYPLRPHWSGNRSVSTWDYYATFGERWSRMCAELLDCKTVVHSLLGADWFSRFASAPEKERKAKLSNDMLNGRRDVQNQVGREYIKENTSNDDWVTSEDLEIRTKDGQLIHPGAHISDQERRMLAMRPNNG